MNNAKHPKEGVVINLTLDGKGSELCFKAQLFSKNFEEEYQRVISWKDIGIMRSDRSDDGKISYIPGRENQESFSDKLVDWVDNLFDKDVIIHQVDIVNNEIFVYVSYDPDMNTYEDLNNNDYMSIWLSIVDAFCTVKEVLCKKRKSYYFEPNFSDGNCIIYF